MSSPSRQERSKKCLACGSEAHRQKDCPTVGNSPKKGQAQQGGGANPNKPSEGQAQVAQQRAEALGFTSKLAAQFGARCLVKEKAHSSVAAAKGEICWISGRYAGLSPTVDDGHLVYRDDGKGNGFTQTLHVRTSTLEPLECLERFEGEAVAVRRRVVGKSPPEAELRAAQLDKHCCPRTWAEFEAAGKALLENCDSLAAKNLLTQVCQATPDEQYQAGMFRRGGVVGSLLLQPHTNQGYKSYSSKLSNPLLLSTLLTLPVKQLRVGKQS